MSMLDRRTQSVQLSLTLPNVRVLVTVRNQAMAMDVQTLVLEFATVPKRGGALGDLPPTGVEELMVPWNESVDALEARLARRDWRKLRGQLLNLDVDDRRGMADWMNRAGYVPRINGQDYPQWAEDSITGIVVQWLRRNRAAIAWLMFQPQRTFAKAINKAWRLKEEQREIMGAKVDAAYFGWPEPKLKNPEIEFARSLKIPLGINLTMLGNNLIGAGVAPNLDALFCWDENGHPRIEVAASCPMQAIMMSVHLDKTFAAVSEWARCANCGKGFEQDRSTDRYCPGGKCKNLYITYRRRMTERANAQWRALSAAKRKRKDRWQWIAEWVWRESHGKYRIDLAWARRLLSNTKKTRTERPR